MRVMPLRCTRRCFPLLIATALLGCADTADTAGTAERPPEVDAVAFNQLFETVNRFALEENEEVLTVTPLVAPLDNGEFVVVDAREKQVRRYDGTGHLVSYFGRPGKGPGELQTPVSAILTSSAGYVVADAEAGGLHLYDSEGNFLDWHNVRLMPMYGALRIDDSRILLMGRPLDFERDELLHIWNLEERMIEKSFFPAPLLELENARDVALAVGWVDVARRGDTLAIVFSLSPRIHHYTLDGTPLGSVELGGKFDFELLEGVKEVPELMQVLPKVRLPTHIFWLEDGSYLIQLAQRNGPDNRWSLMHLSRSGEQRFALQETPRLILVRGNQYLFQDPESDLPNEWVFAERRLEP